MKWITASDLERWADATDARTTLSELVSALVRASARDVGSFRFPTGDSAQIPGYDGRLTAVGVPPYVPHGESVWEFGTDRDYHGKANADFHSRTDNPRGAVRPDTTFVFVTPRVWKLKPGTPVIEEWMGAKRAESDWKSVQIVDAIALEAWLEDHPPVGSRFARQLTRLGRLPSKKGEAPLRPTGAVGPPKPPDHPFRHRSHGNRLEPQDLYPGLQGTQAASGVLTAAFMLGNHCGRKCLSDRHFNWLRNGKVYGLMVCGHSATTPRRRPPAALVVAGELEIVTLPRHADATRPMPDQESSQKRSEFHAARVSAALMITRSLDLPVRGWTEGSSARALLPSSC